MVLPSFPASCNRSRRSTMPVGAVASGVGRARGGNGLLRIMIWRPERLAGLGGMETNHRVGCISWCWKSCVNYQW